MEVPVYVFGGGVTVALIDDADASLCEGPKWWLINGYARQHRWLDGVVVRRAMHRLIMGCPVGFEVDHINGNKLDNRRANLRLASHRQNCQNQRVYTRNTSGFRGVVYCRRTGRWRAKVVSAGRCHSAGYHSTAEQAAHAASVLRERLGFLAGA
jgi:hypothetical protein